MEKLDKIHNEIINNWPFKLKLSYKILEIDLPKEPLLNLLSDFSQIEKLMELKEPIFKYLFFNYKTIQKILNNSDETIIIHLKNNNIFELSYYFYLSLLITYNTNKVDFKYNINIIKNINNQRIEKDNNIKKILKYKIVLDLIENYKQSDEYNEDEDDEILNEIRANINENTFDEFNLGLNANNCKGINMDKIYINIIKSLLGRMNLENTLNILQQLNCEQIIFTKEMFDEILNEDYINDYNILNINDLLNIEKLNFYYILLKYILKNSYYIYQFSFLCKIRIIIIKIIKSNIEILLSSDMSLNIKEKMDYIIEKFTDSKYYFFKYIKYQLEEVLNYYKKVLFESKKEEIKIIENQIKKNNFYNYKEYLTDFNIAQKINKRIPIILYILSKKIENDTVIKKSESLVDKYIKFWEKCEETIKKANYDNINSDDREIIMNFCIDEKNKELFGSIFNEDIYNSFILMKNVNSEKDSTKKNSSSNGNSSLSDEISNLSIGQKKKEISQQSNQKLKSSYLNNTEQLEYTIENKENEIKNISKYQIIRYLKNISNLKDDYLKEGKKTINIPTKTVEFIKEINDKYFISGGINNPINFYDKNLKKIYTFNDIAKKENKSINSICQNSIYDNQNKENKNRFEIIFCCRDKYYLYSFNFEEENKRYINEKKNESKSCLCAIEIQSDNIIKGSRFAFLGEKGVNIISYLYNKFNPKTEEENIYKKPSYGGILIEKKILVFVANCQIYNKKQIKNLIIYDLTKKKIIKDKLNYSFNLSQNSLALMNIKKDTKENKKVLLCACKKYIKGQKNGILVLNYNFNDKEDIKCQFYKTNNFEPYCFCQLSIYEKKSDLLSDNYDIAITNYFIVGGYEPCKFKGIIKLYKLIYINENENIKIKYIEDLIFEDINEIRGPISCIIQSKQNGNIIVSSWDGNIYSFSKPNKEYISFLEKEEDKNFILSNFSN